MVQTLESGRSAVERHAWEEAWETLTEVDREDTLTSANLELLADAAWWAGHPEESVDALERAYAGYVDSPRQPSRSQGRSVFRSPKVGSWS